jgi:hypothetical protein
VKLLITVSTPKCETLHNDVYLEVWNSSLTVSTLKSGTPDVTVFTLKCGTPHNGVCPEVWNPWCNGVYPEVWNSSLTVSIPKSGTPL